MSKATQRWDWAIGLDPNNLTDAHLHQAYKLNWDNLCKFDNCRKNCKRVLCLACFDKSWIDSNDSGASYDGFETSRCEQKRTDLRTFVGLKNLGATCYVNCLLQLWFHNPALRKAIYAWQKNVSAHSDTTRSKVMPSEQGDTKLSPYEDKIQESGTPSKRPRLTTNEARTDEKSTKSNSEISKTNGNEVAIYQNKTPLPDTSSSRADNNIDSNHNVSQNQTANATQTDPIEQLQLIFARLQFTNKKSIDPSNFIESLALNAAEQQDAQEFGNLFIEFLEKSFATQKNKFVANIIKNQFLGRYSYATICDNCKHSSVSDSNFYELDLSIQNLDTLHECLNEYFRPVPLDGKYNCSQCQKAQSAHRKIILKSAPPTLNLQLLRFVYDKQRNTRQKLNSFIVFPEILDMTPYLQEKPNNIRIRLNPFDLSASSVRNRSNIYILTAVLIHRGSSPHSGHYIAHIKDRVTKDWYKFNDDCVEKIGPQLQVSTEGETISILDEQSETIKFNDPVFGKLIKMESKSLKSKTAYMLVYQAHDNEALTYASDHSEKWALPDHLQCAVAEENSKSDELFESLQIAREVDQQVMEARKTQIRTIYNDLVGRDPKDQFEFIDKNWLSNWLSNSSTSVKFSPIDNSHLLCIHDKLDFRKIDQVKCVRSEGLNLLYKEFGGGPRLQDAMCRQCVELEVKLIQLKERLKEEQKIIQSHARFKVSDIGIEEWHNAYIVGRNSYRDWQALAMAQFERKHPELNARKRESAATSSDDEPDNVKQSSTSSNTNVGLVSHNNGGGSTTTIDHTNAVSAGEEGSDSDDDAIEKFVFNSDTECEHGQLIADATLWRIVPKEVWLIFKRYFSDQPDRPLIELNANTGMCVECVKQEAAQQEKGDSQKRIALEQKSKLADLFNMRKRASWCTMIPGDEYYALDRQFLIKWQRWLRNPCNQEKPTTISHNEKLVCKHKLSLFNSDNSNPLQPDSPFVLISRYELSDLKGFYPMDHEIRFFVNPEAVNQKVISHTTAQKSSGPTRQHKSNSVSQHPQHIFDQQPVNSSQDDSDHLGQDLFLEPSSQTPPAAAAAAASTTTNGEHHPSAGETAAPRPQVMTATAIDIDMSDIDWSDCVTSVPAYCSECHELLKQDELRRLLNYESATIYISKFENRTARRNRSRDHAYTIKPNQTLLKLKKEIFARSQVLPVDQRLFLGDCMLDDNSKTMAELKIVPNCSLRLEIDRPASDTVDPIEDEPTSRKSCAQPETGFKGSLLLSNNHF